MNRQKFKITSIVLDSELKSELKAVQQARSLPGVRKMSMSDMARLALRHWLDAGAPMPRVAGSIEQEALGASQQA